MRNTIFTRIVAFSFLFLTIHILPPASSFVSEAQRQSSALGLEGTVWKADQPDEIYSPRLGKYLTREFACAFEEQGKAICRVFVKSASRIKDELYINPHTNKQDYRKVLVPGRMLTEESRVGTYKQNGNSIHIELTAYEIEATIQRNQMNGEITIKIDHNQKARWVARKFSGGNSGSSAPDVSVSRSEKPASDIDKRRIGDELFHKGETSYEKGNYREAIENYTKIVVLDPNNFRAYLERGNVKYYGLKDYQEAIADYDRAIKIDSARHTKAGKKTAGMTVEELNDLSDRISIIAEVITRLRANKNKLGFKPSGCEHPSILCIFDADCEKSKKDCGDDLISTRDSSVGLKLGTYKATAIAPSDGTRGTIRVTIQSIDQEGNVKATLRFSDNMVGDGSGTGSIDAMGNLRLRGVLVTPINDRVFEWDFTLTAKVEGNSLINGQCPHRERQTGFQSQVVFNIATLEGNN